MTGVQTCALPICVAVLVLDSDAVNGNGGAIREPGFHPVGVHVVAAGKQFHHSSILQYLILVCGHSNQCRQVGGGKGDFICRRVSARFLHGFCTVSKRAERHFLSFDIRNLLSPKLLPDGTELIRYIRIGHRTGDIHCPSGFGGFIEPAFILHGLDRKSTRLNSSHPSSSRMPSSA